MPYKYCDCCGEETKHDEVGWCQQCLAIECSLICWNEQPPELAN